MDYYMYILSYYLVTFVLTGLALGFILKKNYQNSDFMVHWTFLFLFLSLHRVCY